MHPAVFIKFEQICIRYQAGGRVLEVGAVPNTDSLLNMKCLANATEKTGLNLKEPARFADFDIVQGNANHMDFEDERFDLVLCNAVLEHDRSFWKSISEILRVTAPGGVIVLGAPGYTTRKDIHYLSWLNRFPWVEKWVSPFTASTRTLRVHPDPEDYYRFSIPAFEHVFLEGLENVQIYSLLTPPRIIGASIKSSKSVNSK